MPARGSVNVSFECVRALNKASDSTATFVVGPRRYEEASLLFPCDCWHAANAQMSTWGHPAWLASPISLVGAFETGACLGKRGQSRAHRSTSMIVQLQT